MFTSSGRQPAHAVLRALRRHEGVRLSFAANIAVELHSRNIDVLAFHPSPVATNFYDKAHKLDACRRTSP